MPSGARTIALDPERNYSSRGQLSGGLSCMNWKRQASRAFFFLCPYTECVAGFVLAALAGNRLLRDGQSIEWIITLVCGLLVLAARLTKVIQEQVKEANTPEPLDLTLETIRLQLGASEEDGARICVHVLEDGELVQVTEYAGTSTTRKLRGRRFSKHCGIAGQAIRTGEAAFSSLPENQELVQFLVSVFSYDRETARKLTETQVAWGAVPIGEPDDCIGVVFVDARSRNFFRGKCGTSRKKVLTRSIPGIAAWLLKRYKK